MTGKIPNSTTLYIGCGNSKLAEEMLADGFSNIYCIDFSDVLIKEIGQRFH
jgi:2-polyprenyl-3-methyl-5-hydroxy-6-metoxy-1,4-benzoquinol methylase